VILVDDCSQDDTLDRLNELADRYGRNWVKVIGLPTNSGPSRARNAGWNAATSEYVAFLDSDDSWHPAKIELQAAFLAADDGLDLIASRMNVQAPDMPAPAIRQPIICSPIPKAVLRLYHNPFPTSSVVLRRSLPFRFDERLRRVEDYHLWARIVLAGRHAAVINQMLSSCHKARFGASGLSGDIFAMNAAGADARRLLYKEGYISAPTLALQTAIAKVRHLRRVLVVGARWAASHTK